MYIEFKLFEDLSKRTMNDPW